MKQYTYKESDRLKEICETLAKDIKSGFTHIEKIDVDQEGQDFPLTYDLIDECQELIETHERNKYNLTKLGGLNSILHYILHHPNAKIRKIACSTFSQTV